MPELAVAAAPDVEVAVTPAPAPVRSVPPVKPEPEDRLPHPVAAAQQQPRLVGAAWVASLLTLATLGWALYAGRVDIMRAWPPSERLYSLLGLVPSHATAPH